MNISLMTEMTNVERMIFHHAGFQFNGLPIVHGSLSVQKLIEASLEVFRLVDGWHSLRWGTGCGYHYVIGNGHGIPDGHVNIWRPECFRGAHVRGQNHDSIGIMLMGDLTKTAPTPKQIQACVNLAKRLCIAHSINPVGTYDQKRHGFSNIGLTISGHKDWRNHKSNDCPGSLHKELPQIRIAVEKMLILEAPISTVYYNREFKRKGDNK